jgi:hypothetical protein
VGKQCLKTKGRRSACPHTQNVLRIHLCTRILPQDNRLTIRVPQPDRRGRMQEFLEGIRGS